jgi:hypothetical protein
MRFLVIFAAISVFAGTTCFSALAQTARDSAQQLQPTQYDHPQLSQDTIVRRHPDWFREPNAYKPCSANVEFANGRRACL